jgi:putative spermidine/putrescine transport system ATP-binding protein
MRDGVIRQVGKPSELYEAPAHLDVAEFMGFRNRLAGRLAGRDGARAMVETEGARLAGTIVSPLADGAAVVLAIRPDDLAVAPPNAEGVRAVVETIEYGGRAFIGTALGLGGSKLVFRSAEPIPQGASVSLVADQDRALVYPAEAIE